jgi:hypothetical protein
MRQSNFPVIAPVLAVAASMALAGAAWACPPGDDRDEAAQTDRPAACAGVEPASDRDRRPCETGVIEHLPDSFFIGGGGVGPQGWDAAGGGRVWVYAAGGASATASAHASASASVRVSVSAHSHRRW